MSKKKVQEEVLAETDIWIKALAEKYLGVEGANSRDLFLPLVEKVKRLLEPDSQVSKGEVRNILSFKAAETQEELEDLIFMPKWLKRGGAAMLVSVSGSGKSVLSIQLALSWAAGKEIFGMKPTRPLKIAIFQTEDDDDEIYEFRESMERGFKELCGWTDEEWLAAAANVDFITTDGEAGDAFLEKLLKTQQMAIRTTGQAYDLVIINPLFAFAGFDLTDNDKLFNFTRKGLDRIIKGKMPDLPVKTALFIIHHTTKPPPANARGGFGVDQYAQYAGFGGNEIPNWLRAAFTLMPDKEPGAYKLVASKKGKRMRWPVPPKAHMPMRFLRQQNNTDDEKEFMFWSEVPWSDVYPGYVEETGGRDAEADAQMLAKEIKKQPMVKTALRNLARKLTGDIKSAEAALQKIYEAYEDYGLRQINKKGGAGTMFCGEDDFEVLSAQNERNLLSFSVK